MQFSLKRTKVNINNQKLRGASKNYFFNDDNFIYSLALALQTLDMKDDPQDNDDGSLPLLPHDFLIRVKNVNPLRDIILPCSLFLCLKIEPIGHFLAAGLQPLVAPRTGFTVVIPALKVHKGLNRIP